MKFLVPQFIEVEDKIFGPLTLKQFIYLAGGAGLCIIFYLVLPWYISLWFIVPTGAFAGALAFYKFNNKPFVALIESLLKYFVNPKLYIWRKEQAPLQAPVAAPKVESPAFIPKLSNSKLKDLTWSLDTKENLR
jgi:hypothetical protein